MVCGGVVWCRVVCCGGVGRGAAEVSGRSALSVPAHVRSCCLGCDCKLRGAAGGRAAAAAGMHCVPSAPCHAMLCFEARTATARPKHSPAPAKHKSLAPRTVILRASLPLQS